MLSGYQPFSPNVPKDLLIFVDIDKEPTGQLGRRAEWRLMTVWASWALVWGIYYAGGCPAPKDAACDVFREAEASNYCYYLDKNKILPTI
jgi:hypothetical protein